MFTSETQVRVRYAETDQMGVVYHSNYFPYFESARAESIRQLGFTYADMEKMESHLRLGSSARWYRTRTRRCSST